MPPMRILARLGAACEAHYIEILRPRIRKGERRRLITVASLTARRRSVNRAPYDPNNIGEAQEGIGGEPVPLS